jgi:hypothetical protein
MMMMMMDRIRKEAVGLRPVFQKSLTQSDVSDQQSRLLMKRDSAGCLGQHNIPVKNIRPNVDVHMWDEDEHGLRRWHFVFAIWPSNDSYVLKGGWSSFIDYKALHVGDLITISVDVHGDHWIRCTRPPPALPAPAPAFLHPRIQLID